MATCLDVIKGALIWRGVIDEEEDPSPRQAASGLASLKGIYLDIIGGRELTPVTITAAFTAGENQRVIDVSGSAVQVTLPATITDPGTNCTRPPFDRSIIVIAGSTPQSLIYDAAIGDWIDVGQLKLTDEAPVSASHLEGLTARLSAVLRYPGVAVDPAASVAAAAFRSAMGGHWDVESRPVRTDYF